MITFMRIDDNFVHAMIITRWLKEYPCDGIVAVNDKIAKNPVLSQSYKSGTEKKVLIWTMEQFKKKAQTIAESSKNYFLITKTCEDMEEILVNFKFVPNQVKTLVMGPCYERENTIEVGNDQFYSQEQAKSLEAISKQGYTIDFCLIPDSSIGTWDTFKNKFGY